MNILKECQEMAAKANFTDYQKSKFSQHISECLKNDDCRNILKQYLRTTLRPPQLLNALELWAMATSPDSYNEAASRDLIYRIENFISEPLDNMRDASERLDYIRSECCRILGQIHTQFIENVFT